MKKILITWMSMMLVVVAFAQGKENAVTMVSYEQRWLDHEGTLALKNNTQEEIFNVTFRIVYIDMQGNELDYAEFSKNVSIEPGMTRKVNIRAYEWERDYHYYKSENSPTGSPAFKIKFMLKDFNTSVVKGKDNDAASVIDAYFNATEDNDRRETRGMGTAMPEFIAMVLIMSALMGLYFLVAVMARQRGRNMALWMFLSILFTPMVICVVLLIVGRAYRSPAQEFQSSSSTDRWGN